MHVAIVGSRDWPDLPRVRRYVERIAEKYPAAVIVSGGARGVDRAAETAAHMIGLNWVSYRPYEYENMSHRPEFSIETVTCGEAAQELVVAKSRRINPPFFSSYGKAAFFRNGWIVEDAEIVVAFQVNGSRGTADSIRRARSLGRATYVYN